MNIPSEQECMELLEELNPRIMKHSVYVKDLALEIADSMERKGAKVNRDLLIAGALLHDITKSHVGDRHNLTGEALLVKLGYPEVGRIVRKHFLGTNPETPEQKIIYYVDKIVNPGRVKVSIEERMKYVFDKYDIPEEKFSIFYNEIKNIENELLGESS